MSDQSDPDFASSNQIGQDILQSQQKAADGLKRVGRRREGSHISFKMPQIGLQSSIIGLKSSRLKFSFTKREWSVQNSGSAHFSLRLKNACLGKCSRSAIPQQHTASILTEKLLCHRRMIAPDEQGKQRDRNADQRCADEEILETY